MTQLTMRYMHTHTHQKYTKQSIDDHLVEIAMTQKKHLSHGSCHCHSIRQKTNKQHQPDGQQKRKRDKWSLHYYYPSCAPLERALLFLGMFLDVLVQGLWSGAGKDHYILI